MPSDYREKRTKLQLFGMLPFAPWLFAPLGWHSHKASTLKSIFYLGLRYYQLSKDNEGYNT